MNKNSEINYKLCENIYNVIVVLKIYCEYCQKAEEISVILPLIDYLQSESDKLCARLLNEKCSANYPRHSCKYVD